MRLLLLLFQCCRVLMLHVRVHYYLLLLLLLLFQCWRVLMLHVRLHQHLLLLLLLAPSLLCRQHGPHEIRQAGCLGLVSCRRALVLASAKLLLRLLLLGGLLLRLLLVCGAVLRLQWAALGSLAGRQLLWRWRGCGVP
jgi:hypothetical protein